MKSTGREIDVHRQLISTAICKTLIQDFHQTFRITWEFLNVSPIQLRKNGSVVIMWFRQWYSISKIFFFILVQEQNDCDIACLPKILKCTVLLCTLHTQSSSGKVIDSIFCHSSSLIFLTNKYYFKTCNRGRVRAREKIYFFYFLSIPEDTIVYEWVPLLKMVFECKFINK